MNVKSFGLTHVGRQRQHNEDSFLVQNESRLFLVADGMGGHAAGEIASRIAVDSIEEFIVHTKEDDGTWSLRWAVVPGLLQSRVRLVA